MKGIVKPDPVQEFSRVSTDALYALRDSVRHLGMCVRMLKESNAVRDHVQAAGLNPDSVADYMHQKYETAYRTKVHVEMQLFGKATDAIPY